MKRYIPLVAFATILAIAVVAVMGFDIVSLAHAHHDYGTMVAEAGAGVAAAEELAREFEAHLTEVKSLLQKGDVKDGELSARVTEIEQKMARRGSGDNGSAVDPTWGEQLAKSDELKALVEKGRGIARLKLKTTVTTATAGALVAPDRPAGIIELPRRRVRIRDLVSPGQTTSNSIEWPRQTTRTNNAAMQTAEGAAKAESAMAFDLDTWPVRTLAHWIPAAKQILDDAPGLASMVDSDLRYGLALTEEAQLLNGGGTGQDLKGLYTGAAAFVSPFAVQDETQLDRLLQAIAQAEDGDYEVDGIVLNPLDWREMQALKDAEGRYLGNGPFTDEQVARLWQMPVAATKAMTRGKFLVGAFKQGAQIFDRQEAVVEVSTEHADFFTRNLVAIRAEQRLAFVVKYEDAFVKGDLFTV